VIVMSMTTNNSRVLFYLLFPVIFWSLNFDDFKIII